MKSETYIFSAHFWTDGNEGSQVKSFEVEKRSDNTYTIHTTNEVEGGTNSYCNLRVKNLDDAFKETMKWLNFTKGSDNYEKCYDLLTALRYL